MIMHQIKSHHSKENKVTEVPTGVSVFNNTTSEITLLQQFCWFIFFKQLADIYLLVKLQGFYCQMSQLPHWEM